MKEETITCINCPVGCRMTVQIEDGAVLSVTGNTCKRGDTYARQECISPMRMVTAVVPVEGSATPLSVKTRTPVPKKLIKECMRCIDQAKPRLPVEIGDVIVPSVAGTGVDVIATRALS